VIVCAPQPPTFGYVLLRRHLFFSQDEKAWNQEGASIRILSSDGTPREAKTLGVEKKKHKLDRPRVTLAH